MHGKNLTKLEYAQIRTKPDECVHWGMKTNLTGHQDEFTTYG